MGGFFTLYIQRKYKQKLLILTNHIFINIILLIKHILKIQL